MEQIDPKDLFYQILDGLRSLTQYDHSSALLIREEGEPALRLVAEQVAWTKAKSRGSVFGCRSRKTSPRRCSRGRSTASIATAAGGSNGTGPPPRGLARLLDYNIDDADEP